MTAVNLYLSSPCLGLGNRRFDEKTSIREAMTNSQNNANQTFNSFQDNLVGFFSEKKALIVTS